MKQLVREFIGDGQPLVHVHMNDGKIYANLRVEKVSDSAFKARNTDGYVHLISYDAVKQIKSAE